MKKKIFTLLACAAMFGFAHAFPTCNLTKTPPTIDGDASDWGSTWLQMTQTPTGQTSDMTSKFQMEYDSTNLYIIAVIKDKTIGDTLVTTASYARDCFEVMMSLDTTSSGGQTGMFQFRRVYGWNGTTGHPGGNSGITDGSGWGADPAVPKSWNDNPKFKVVEAIDGDTYTQEWQLPWDSLSVRMSPAWDKKQFKLELQSADNTGTDRTQQNFWYGSSNSGWNNSAFQQVVTLQFPVAVNTPSKLKDMTASVINRNTIKLSRVAKVVTVYTVNGQKIQTVNNTDVISGLKSGNLYFIKADDNNLKVVLQ